MQQKELKVVIDAWASAIEDLAQHAPPDAQQRLRVATGDLLEAFASTSTELGIAPIADVLVRLDAIERRANRRGEIDEDMQRQIDQLADRTELLEEQRLDTKKAGA
jgi:hypothetical protein